MDIDLCASYEKFKYTPALARIVDLRDRGIDPSAPIRIGAEYARTNASGDPGL